MTNWSNKENKYYFVMKYLILISVLYTNLYNIIYKSYIDHEEEEKI